MGPPSFAHSEDGSPMTAGHFCRSATPRESRVRAWAGVLFVVLGLAPAGASGQALQIPYTGHRVAHVVYDHSNPAASSMELRAKRPSANWAVLDSGSVHISGRRRDADLEPGDHEYEIREFVGTNWNRVAYEVARPDGVSVGGTLQYDESFAASTVVARAVTVPAERTLAIEGVRVTPSNQTITVFGDIRLSSDAVVEPFIILRSRAFHFDSPGQVNLIFWPDTAGSSIARGTNVYAEFRHTDFSLADCGRSARIAVVTPNAVLANLKNVTLMPACSNFTLTGASNVWVELGDVRGDVDIRQSAINFDGRSSSQPQMARKFNFEKVIWRSEHSGFGGAVRLYAPATLTKSDFDKLEVVRTSLTANESAFGGLTLENASAGSRLDQCFLRGGTWVVSGAPAFIDCEFGGDVVLENRSETVIESCILLGAIRLAQSAGWYPPQWHEASSPSPTIRNNSFLGPTAFTVQDGMPALPAPVAIGANYYGDPGGLRMGEPDAEFLGFARGHEGAWVTGPDAARFQFGAPQASGKTTRKDSKVFPKFWVNGWIAGQNTIGHHANVSPEMMQGRDTLLSVELLTSDFHIGPVSVYAEYNGNRQYARFKGPISRDIKAGTPEQIWQGISRTFDIVLPAHSESTMPVRVFADLSGVGGFDPEVMPTNPVTLVDTTLSFPRAPPTRDLVIDVVPLRISGLLFAYGPPPVAPVAQALKRHLPAMFPIPGDRVKVRMDIPITVYSSADWVSAVPLMYKIAAVLTARERVCRAYQNNPQYTPADFIVGVVPQGALHVFLGWGKADGANTKILRSVVLVDESKPMAVLHELGHAMGLFLAKEQYDLYPPSGRRVEAATAFWTEPAGPQGKFMAYNRALHFPDARYNWFKDFDWFDVMSNVDDTIWPIRSTIVSFEDWIRANLYGPPRTRQSTSAASGKVGLLSEPPAGSRRILLTGETLKQRTSAQHDFFTNTLAIFDLTGQNLDPIPAPTSGIWQALHVFRAYNAATAKVYESEFYIPVSSDPIQPWVSTFDVPQTARRLTIEQDDWLWGAKTVAAWRARGSITNRILSPVAGGAVSNELTLSWRAACEDAAWSSNLAHLVLFSTNGGTSWLNPSVPQMGTQLVMQTEFLPPCGNLAIRLVTSDGFTNFQSTVTGLTVPNRAPRVSIIEPYDGDVALTGTLWRLLAQVQDYDGNVSTAGVWSSSIQGMLGSNDLVQCVLTQGAHTLRYAVRDDAGAAVTASVRVTVSPAVTSINLGLESNSLRVASRLADPVSPSPAHLLTLGSTNLLFLRIRTPAVPGSVRVSLHLQQPSGASQLLRQQTASFSEAGWLNLGASFIPTQYGAHVVSAVLDQITPTDSHAADNSRSWRLDTRDPQLTPSRRFVQLEYVLGPSENPAPGQIYYQSARIDLYNTGLDDLRVGAPWMSGPNAARCRVYNNQATNPIAPTGSSYLFVECGMTNRGLFRSTLNLPSNDPLNPVVTVDFLALLYNAGQNVDTDGDGIYDFIEAVMGTSTNLADTDSDGLADGLEDVNRNGILDPGETDARNSDTDGDRLADGVEDANRNGVWDYGETDPRVWDTDGDGIGDGDEIVAGTHPFLAGSFLGLDYFGRSTAPTGFVVRWRSVDGKRYAVARSTNLLTGFNHYVATNILGVAPLNTVTDTTAAGSSPRLYRIEIK